MVIELLQYIATYVYIAALRGHCASKQDLDEKIDTD